MLTIEEACELAVKNVASFGDTDVFPFPIENRLFHDLASEVVDLLRQIDSDFEAVLTRSPPTADRALSAVGYSGFRWVSQIDPLWNAYLLSLVVALGDEIEQERVPVSRSTVFSYRFSLDRREGSCWNSDIGWREYQAESVSRAEAHSFVLSTDIANFYPGIYHHRLENALKAAAPNRHYVGRIMAILKELSVGVSYGLPVGGPAARLLSELVLNRMDRLIQTEGYTFCRFADDYNLFVDSQEDAYNALIFLNERLLENEGLSLQKSKTRIMSSEEFAAHSQSGLEADAETPEEVATRKFLSFRIRFDPYSPTAEDDYESLRDELTKFDIVGMLAREMQKSRIHQTAVRKLIASVRYLPDRERGLAVQSILDNLRALYPLFPSVMILLKAVVSELEEGLGTEVYSAVRCLVSSASHITRVPVNLAYALRVLADDRSDETESLLNGIYKTTEKAFIKRDIILIMARRNSDYWISNARKSYQAMGSAEKRAMLVASYLLEDEGRHWRKGVRGSLNPFERLMLKWASAKKEADPTWRVPI